MRAARQIWRERLVRTERFIALAGGWGTLGLFIYWLITAVH